MPGWGEGEALRQGPCQVHARVCVCGGGGGTEAGALSGACQGGGGGALNARVWGGQCVWGGTKVIPIP